MGQPILPSTAELRFERNGSVGLITLERPQALNALTHAMCIALDQALTTWAADASIAAVVICGAGGRAFCAGGDVRALYDAGLAQKRGEPEGRIAGEFIRDEYRMNRRVKTFPKPYIALMNGLTMGGGLGISVHGSHRVTTERTLFAMPETAIGLFPDVGASYVLPRLPGEIGCYLGLTGVRIKAPDLLAIGLASHYVPSERLGQLVRDLVAADWSDHPMRVADEILAVHAMAVDAPQLAGRRATIGRCFSARTSHDILSALDADGGDFAAETAAIIRSMSPTAIKLALEANRRGADLSFEDCLVMEYRLIQAILWRQDFYEGVRALLIDKNRRPQWNPATLDAVDDASLEQYFVAPSFGDLTFVE
jgi:enoyl-CoA hydratase